MTKLFKPDTIARFKCTQILSVSIKQNLCRTWPCCTERFPAEEHFQQGAEIEASARGPVLSDSRRHSLTVSALGEVLGHTTSQTKRMCRGGTKIDVDNNGEEPQMVWCRSVCIGGVVSRGHTAM